MLPHRIFIIRHAKPQVNRNGFFSASDASKFLTAYDAAEVEEFVLKHEAIPFQRVKKVFCSTLTRSQLTAKAIFGDKVELIIDHSFREFERKIFSLPLLRLPVDFWLLSSRILWFMGLNNSGIETFEEARQRARDCANLLAQEAIQNNDAILVAHGLLNNFIIRELKNMGWEQTERGGSDYVSVNIVEKKNQVV